MYLYIYICVHKYVLGSKSGIRGRGNKPKTINVNIINTFKCVEGGNVVPSKACRWAQLRFVELGKAVEAWASATMCPFTVSTRRRLQDLTAATMKRGIIASPFARFDLCLKKVFHPKLKSVCSQLVEFVRVTGFRRPNAEIAKAIAARCAMFASFALAEANRLDDEEVSEKTSAW